MADRKTRGKNFSDYERNLLIEFVKKHDIILSKNKDSKTTAQKEKTWLALVDEFNADPKVTKRDLECVKVCLNNLIKKAKKDQADWTKERTKTGGGQNTMQSSSSSSALIGLMPAVFQPLSVADCDDESEIVLGKKLLFI
jgi:hypothetical protein